jgi:hypothetical protein
MSSERMGARKPPLFSRRRLQNIWEFRIPSHKRSRKQRNSLRAGQIQRSVFFDEDIKAIMSSYAYSLSGAFGFSVAFAELCAIKARAQGAVLFADMFVPLC